MIMLFFAGMYPVGNFRLTANSHSLGTSKPVIPHPNKLELNIKGHFREFKLSQAGKTDVFLTVP